MYDLIKFDFKLYNTGSSEQVLITDISGSTKPKTGWRGMAQSFSSSNKLQCVWYRTGEIGVWRLGEGLKGSRDMAHPFNSSNNPSVYGTEQVR